MTRTQLVALDFFLSPLPLPISHFLLVLIHVLIGLYLVQEYEIMLDPQDTIESTVNSHLQHVGLVVLYWDFAITFGDEVRFLWKSPRSHRFGAICFFLNRYIPIFANIVVVVLSPVEAYTELITLRLCKVFLSYHQFLIIAHQCVVGFMLAVRVYALYGGNRRMAYALGGLAVCCVGLALWSVLTPRETLPISCPNPPMSNDAARKVVLPWLAMLVFDSVIFGLTLTQSWRMTNRDGYRISVPLVHLLMRDGAMYFGVMIIANLANILTFYLLGPRLRGSLSTLASSISVTMMSRLMINLHKSAAGIMASARRSDTDAPPGDTPINRSHSRTGERSEDAVPPLTTILEDGNLEYTDGELFEMRPLR